MKTISVIALALLAVGIAARTASAIAQPYPIKPVRLMVPFGSGSGSDIAARFFGDQLAGVIGQPLVIENRPGANGVIGMMAAKNAPADGYTLLLGSWTTISVNPIAVKDLAYDPVQDFKPISGLTRSMIGIAVPGGSGIKSVADLVSTAKAGRALNVGTYSTGFHIILESFNAAAGIKLVNVPYKAAGQAHTDVMGSQIDAVMDGTTSLGPMFRSGKLRLLAASGERRDPAFADVPTFRESGYPDFVVWGWSSFFVRAETPEEPTQKLADAMQKVLVSSVTQDFAKKNGSDLMLFGPAAMRKFQLDEIGKFRRVAAAAGIRPE
ncbi:MAG: tripartite tricarboxylate transporter substrate binding protein [Betaproteobacteria bacterium]|nr:tripartite tricarboxylate transporter substrate binding protein [Betaproteobacteria bacterium]